MSFQAAPASKSSSLWRRISRNWGLYLLLLPAVVILLLFTYQPMVGIVIAFKDFTPAKGIFESPWAGMKYFQEYFNSYQFWPTIKNTLVISLYTILVTFPLPIVVALLCNQISSRGYKKFFQVSTYLPHFISTVVMCGMIILFLSPSTGAVSYTHLANTPSSTSPKRWPLCSSTSSTTTGSCRCPPSSRFPASRATRAWASAWSKSRWSRPSAPTSSSTKKIKEKVT